MAEIARATKINTASCHAILSALTGQGYLTRSDDEKRYKLGVALIAIGRAASISQPLISRAQTAAEQLADVLKVSVLLSTVVNDEILGLTIRAGSDGRGLGIQPGQRFPLAAPAGTHFLAWASEEEVERWIARAGDSSEEQIREWRDALDLVRSRGYQVTLDVPVAPEFAELMAEMARGHQPLSFKEHAQQFLTSHSWPLEQPRTIEPDEEYSVNLIAAPIFDRSGKAILSLGIGKFGRAISGREIADYAQSVMQTCLDVMALDRVTPGD